MGSKSQPAILELHMQLLDPRFQWGALNLHPQVADLQVQQFGVTPSLPGKGRVFRNGWPSSCGSCGS